MTKEIPQNIEEGSLEEVEPDSTSEDLPTSPAVEGIQGEIREDAHDQIEDLQQGAEEGDAELSSDALRAVSTEPEQKTEEAEEKLVSDMPAKEYFEKYIKVKLDETMNALDLTSVVEQSKTKLSQVDANDLKAKVKLEEEAVRDLSKAIASTEFKKWAFTPESMIDMKACNCSGAALIFAYIMNEKLNIETKQVNPSGHAANIVYYSDKSTEYVDPRNKQFHKISLKPENLEENIEGYDLYNVKKWGLEFRKLPIIDYEEGAANTLLNNTVWMDIEKDKDPEAKEALEKYSDSEKLAFAQHFSSSKFLDTRDKDESWIVEKKRVQRIRRVQKIPLIGRFF